MGAQVFKKIIQNALDSIFPKICLSCGAEGSFVCEKCFSKIPVNASQKCFFCGRRSPEMKICKECRNKNHFALDGILIASDWRNLLVRQLVYECKYRFVRELAQTMAEIILLFLKTNFPPSWRGCKPIIIPAPLHRRRQAWRGFNQAESIAQTFASSLELQMYKEILVRRRHTSPQADIHDRNDRIKNIAGAFELSRNFSNGEVLKNKIVVLIDDVSTTGSTLDECARLLKKFRPKEIWGLVLARG